MKKILLLLILCFVGVNANNVNFPNNSHLFDRTIDIKVRTISIIPSADNILYVNIAVSGGNESGDSWANAIPELGNALKYAKQQDNYTGANPLKIFVAIGTYKPLYSPADNNFGNDASRYNTFLMVKDVHLYGGFDPENGIKDLTDIRILPFSAGAGGGTILSGDLNADDGADFTNNSENTYHVVVSSDDVSSAKLDGFTITGGNANGSGTVFINGLELFVKFGGGIQNFISSPSLINVSLNGNSALMGGGMHNRSVSFPSLTNVTISGNRATEYGGGIRNINNSSPILTNVTLSDNSAILGGGGMYNTINCNPKLINSIVWGNTTAGSVGDGLYDYQNINFPSSTSIISYSLVQDIDNTADNGLDGTDVDNDPKFTDAANGDYSLQATSPAIMLGERATKYYLDSMDLPVTVTLLEPDIAHRLKQEMQ